MRLFEAIPERSDLIELARASETAVGRAYERVLREKLDEVMKAMRKKPKMNPTDIRDDIRYQFGMMDGLEFVLRLQEEALEEISKPEKEN